MLFTHMYVVKLCKQSDSILKHTLENQFDQTNSRKNIGKSVKGNFDYEKADKFGFTSIGIESIII